MRNNEKVTRTAYLSALETINKFHHQEEEKEALAPSIMETPIEDVFRSQRIINVFKTLNITKVKDVISFGVGRLRLIRNLGPTSMAEIERTLAELGVS